MIKAIIFDLDDTLYNEKEFVLSGLKAASKVSEKDKRAYKKIIKIYSKEGRDKIFNKYLEKLDIPKKEKKELLKKMIKTYRLHKPNLKPYKYFYEFIKKNYKNYFLILLTDGHTQVQKNKFKSLNLKKFFDMEIYTGMNVNKHKPAEWSYKKIIKKFELNPHEILCVGDNPNKDFITPNKMGMYTLRIKKGRFKNLKGCNDAKYDIEKFNGSFIKKIGEIERRVIK